jgi:membrane peptidoglycan carboxypeptidase
MPAAVKTGASEPFADDTKNTADTWTLGFTSELVTGVWAGNSDNEPVHNLFSTTIAWNVWNDFMIGAHTLLDLEAKPFELPSSVVERVVCWPSGNIASDTCPSDRRYQSLFMKDVKVPVDTWWSRLPAGRLVLRVPASFRGATGDRLVSNPADNGSAAAGALANAIAARPPDVSALAAPLDGSTVSGGIAVIGTARSSQMLGYYLDAIGGGMQVSLGEGLNGRAGQLATWDTRSVPNGAYTLRLVVQDSQRGTMIDTARVTVVN